MNGRAVNFACPERRCTAAATSARFLGADGHAEAQALPDRRLAGDMARRNRRRARSPITRGVSASGSSGNLALPFRKTFSFNGVQFHTLFRRRKIIAGIVWPTRASRLRCPVESAPEGSDVGGQLLRVTETRGSAVAGRARTALDPTLVEEGNRIGPVRAEDRLVPDQKLMPLPA